MIPRALTTAFVCLLYMLQAQPRNFTFIEDADEHYKNHNYLSAVSIYKAELKKDPDNAYIKYRLGICYLNCRVNRAEAIPLLEQASRERSADAEVWVHLGRAYHLNNRIEEAIASFEKFAAMRPGRADEVNHYLEQCESAQHFMRYPRNVTFQNLGPDINSTEPDYSPFIDKDEMHMVFTTRRKENFGGKKIEIDGYRSSDIYQSTMVNGYWTTARNIGRTVNGNLDEQVVGLRSDGLEMYMYLDRIEKYGDLYVTSRKDFASEFSKPKLCDGGVNMEIETSGCMNEEGTVMIFSRKNRLKDNSDLYIARKLPNGKWGLPQPLPENVNSPYDEDMPFISHDGGTLYFASQGHNSMGGYDLFRSEWDPASNTFSDPVNLGFPINSTDDDRSICVTNDNRFAYVSAFRPSGLGDLDIYRVKFEDQEPVSVIYTGRFFLGDSSLQAQPPDYDVKVTVVNTQTNYEYMYIPHSKTGRYVMALPAGKYRLTTYAKGYVRHKEELIVSDIGRVNLEREKDIYLRKLRKKN